MQTPSVKKEPWIHITKRPALPWWHSILIRLGAVVCALVATALFIILITGENPFKIFASMFDGAFGTPHRVWTLLNALAILLGISLAVTPAFRMRFWNCGAEGQVLIGALATASCMLWIGDAIPLPLLFIVMIVASVAAGAVWGVIPAIFKARWNTNETLFTLMMNYIAIQLICFCLKKWATNGSGVLPTMPAFRFPRILGQDYLLSILVIAVVCVAMHIYLKYSKQGYEISVVGESENTARYIGINVRRVIIRTMIVSGALCGLVGLLLVANGSCTITTDLAGGRGFTAIMVSWLGKFNPVYMIATAFLIVFLERGTNQVAIDFRTDTAICDIIVALILFFIIGSEFFINYKIHIRHRKKKEKEDAAV